MKTAIDFQQAFGSHIILLFIQDLYPGDKLHVYIICGEGVSSRARPRKAFEFTTVVRACKPTYMCMNM